MARGAIGRGEVAALQREPVKALHIRREHVRRQPVLRNDPLRGVALAAGFRDVGRRHARRRQLHGLNRMFPVAICADGRIADAGFHGGAVDAAHVGVLDVFVAFATGVRHVLPVQFRGWVGGLVQIMRAVAIRANRGVHFFFLEQRDAVNAAAVADDRTVLPEMKLLHLLRLAVTMPAGVRLVGPVHRRGRVAIIKQLVRLAVAILAGRRFRHAFVNRLPVIAFQINFRLDPVTLAATYRLMRLRMRQIGNVGVTTGAKVLAVNGHRKLRFIHEQRNNLAGGVALRQRLVRMTSETVRIIQRHRCPRERNRDNRRQHQTALLRHHQRSALCHGDCENSSGELLLHLGIGVRDFLEVGLLVKPLEVGTLLVVTERAGLRCRVNQASGNGFIAVFHHALEHELLARPVAGLADHAVLGFDLLCRDRLGEIVRGRMALQTFPARLRIINAEFLGRILGRLRPEHLKRLRVRARLPLGDLIAALFLLVTNATQLHPDIIRRITLRRPSPNGQQQHNTRT